MRAASWPLSTVRAASAAIVVAGVLAGRRVPLDVRLAHEAPRLTVQAVWPGAAPESVEEDLTAPIEAAVQGVRGVRQVSSVSLEHMALLTITLDANADVALTRLAIIERLDLLRPMWPPGVVPPKVADAVPPGMDEPPLVTILAAGPLTPSALARVLTDRVRPRVTAIPGVAGVTVRGGATPTLTVTYDPAQLRAHQVSATALETALASARMVAMAGMVREHATARSERAVVLRDAVTTRDALAALPVRQANGGTTTVGDLATVSETEEAAGAVFRVNGRSAVTLDVMRQAGADPIATAAAIRAVVASLHGGVPSSATLTILSDDSRRLARAVDQVLRQALLAGLLTTGVLLLGLPDGRAIVAAWCSTVVALAATAATMFVAGVPATLPSLAGIAMGLGALLHAPLRLAVDLLADERATPGPSHARGARVAALPTLVSLAAAGAVLLIPHPGQGTSRPAVLGLALASLYSLLAARFVLPALLPAERAAPANATPHWRTRMRCVGGTCVVSALGLLGRHTAALAARGDGGTAPMLVVSLSSRRGGDPRVLDRVIRDVEALLVGRPGVPDVRVLAVQGTHAQVAARFTEGAVVAGEGTAVRAALMATAARIGGVEITIQGVGPVFAVGSGVTPLSRFRVQVAGPEYDAVVRLTDDVRQRLRQIPRVRDVQLEAGLGRSLLGADGLPGTRVTLAPDRPALGRYGVTAEGFARAVARATRGSAGMLRVRRDGQEIPLLVKASGAWDRTVDALTALPLPSARGAPVRVGQVARIEEEASLSGVVREDQQYVRQVSYTVRAPASRANRIHAAFLRRIRVPAGYVVNDMTTGSLETEGTAPEALRLVVVGGLVAAVLAMAWVTNTVGMAGRLMALLVAAAGGAMAAVGGANHDDLHSAVWALLPVSLIAAQLCMMPLHRAEGRWGHHAIASVRWMVPRLLLVVASVVPWAAGPGGQTPATVMARAVLGGVGGAALGALLLRPWLLVRPQKG